MNKIQKTPFFMLAVIFALSFIYLHQKVQIYVAAYQLSRNSQAYNELVDKRDYLMYNFSKKIPLAKVNQWAQEHDFGLIDKERKLALNLKADGLSVNKDSPLAFLYSRFINIPAGSSTALAEDKE